MFLKKKLGGVLVGIGTAGICWAQDTTASLKDSVRLHDTIVSVNEPVASDIKAKPLKQPVFKMNWPVDIPYTVITCGISLYGFTKIYNKTPVTAETVASLDPKQVNRFDRSATRHYSESANKIADNLFYGSMPLPVLFLLDNKMRKDLPRLVTLYLEAMGTTGIFYVSAVYFGDRYRPYVYNPDVPLHFKLRGGSKNSFFAGHPALVGTSTFFMASAYAMYHPESKIRWVFYTLAGAATAATALSRYYGGRHFPSDLIIGVTLGPASGMLIPRLHKNKDLGKRKTAIMPFFGESSGLVLIHNF